jgi:hypothetical protein
MPSFGPILEAAVKAFKSPAIPEAIARGTAENPAVLEAAAKALPRTRLIAGTDIPFKGEPELLTHTRTTSNPAKTLPENVQDFKSLILGFFNRDPNQAKDIQAKFYRGRWRSAAAQDMADRDVAQWHEPLKRAPAEQARDMHDYLGTANDVAQALRNGESTIQTHDLEGKVHTFPLQLFRDQLEKFRPVVQNDPEIQASILKVRAGFDDMFDDMVERGWTVPEHYLEDYTPVRRLNSVIKGLASISGETSEELKSRILSSMQHRSKLSKGLRDANLLGLMRTVRTEYYKKVAEHETFLDFVADKTLNLTEKFSIGDELPRGVGVYTSGPGMMGFMRKTAEENTLDAAQHALTIGTGETKERIYNGGFVFPEALVTSLKNYHRPEHGTQETRFYKASLGIARMFTVYNLANTWVNKIGDPFIALLGLPGEKAQPLGIVKWLGTANRAAYAGAFGKGNTLVKIGDQVIDVWDLALSEGVVGGTITHDLGLGGHVPEALLRLVPEAQRKHETWLQKIKQTFAADRLAVEMTPRLAAGMEALERTGSTAEFGRVARQATLPYGAGTPRLATFPALRMISPFMTFIGLGSERVMALQKTKGSKGRTLAALAALPVLTMMWNTQNPEYEEAENSLKEYERNTTHVWIPQWDDPNKIRRDINGKPVALRIKYWLPEEVLRLVGLGNLASRLMRVSKGRDTPAQFGKSVVRQIGQSIVDLSVMPTVVSEVVSGKTRAGQSLDIAQRLARIAPISRIPIEAYKRSEGYDPKTALVEGTKGAVEETMGLRFANVDRRDKTLVDAQLMDARYARDDAKRAVKAARKNGPAAVKKALKEFTRTQKELVRIVAVVKAERAASKATGAVPDRPSDEVDALKDAAVKKVLKEYRARQREQKEKP